jgi:hypothetical protein
MSLNDCGFNKDAPCLDTLNFMHCAFDSVAKTATNKATPRAHFDVLIIDLI